jgi:hypothetical protein
MQNPDGLTIFDKLNSDYHIRLKNKHFKSDRDGQFDLSDCAHRHWLFHSLLIGI